MRIKLVAAAIGAMLAAGGVAAATTMLIADSGDTSRPKVVISDADQLLPSETLTDWATYGDHLVVATVVGERALAQTDEEIAANEGFVPRVIRLRIDQVLWSRADAPKSPTSFETDLDGWVVTDGQRTPLRLQGEPMMSVGKRYVLPIVCFSTTRKVANAGWSTLSPESIFPDQDDMLGKGDVIPSERTDTGSPSGAGPSSAGPSSNGAPGETPRDRFAGKDASNLAAALAATPADPAVADAMDLPPDVRVQHARH